MAKVMLNNANKKALLLDWKNSTANRTNELYFISEDINEKEVIEACFAAKILIKIETVDAILSKITFVDDLI